MRHIEHSAASLSPPLFAWVPVALLAHELLERSIVFLELRVEARAVGVLVACCALHGVTGRVLVHLLVTLHVDAEELVCLARLCVGVVGAARTDWRVLMPSAPTAAKTDLATSLSTLRNDW